MIKIRDMMSKANNENTDRRTFTRVKFSRCWRAFFLSFLTTDSENVEQYKSNHNTTNYAYS